jgi:hypothetical protein
VEILPAELWATFRARKGEVWQILFTAAFRPDEPGLPVIILLKKTYSVKPIDAMNTRCHRSTNPEENQHRPDVCDIFDEEAEVLFAQFVLFSNASLQETVTPAIPNAVNPG